jgi:hypothetical protein
MGRPKLTQCKHGHDTSAPNSRDSSNNCKACKVVRDADPVVKANRAVYNARPEKVAENRQRSSL